VIADGIVAAAHALALDLRVVASCCSTGLDAARAAVVSGASGGPRDAAALAFVVFAGVAIASSAFARRRPSAGAAALVGIASLLASAAALPAIVWWTAPHAYETPAHLCPFCLLHADVLGIGWPLFAALFAGTVLGLSAGAVGALEARTGEPDAARAMSARLGGAAGVAWALALALAVLPVVRWAIVSGGAPLFGAA
jgi:hypothetical protein